MDLIAFKRQLDAANEFEVSEDGISLRLCQPTEIQIRSAAARASVGFTDHGERVALLVSNMQPHLLRDALVGWSGVTQRHLLPGAPDEVLPFDKSLVDRVFSRWPGLYDKAYDEIQRRYDDHRTTMEAEEKNS